MSSKLYVVLNYGPNTMLVYGQNRSDFAPKLKGLTARWTTKLKEGFTKVIEGGWLIPKKNFDRLKSLCDENSIVIEEEKLRELKTFEAPSLPPPLESKEEKETPRIIYSDSEDNDKNYHRSLSAIKDMIVSDGKVKKFSKKQEDRKKKSMEESVEVRSSKSSDSESDSGSSSESKSGSDSESDVENSDVLPSPSDIDSDEEDCKSLARRVRVIITYLKKHAK
jgi:hypothetical protein